MISPAKTPSADVLPILAWGEIIIVRPFACTPPMTKESSVTRAWLTFPFTPSNLNPVLVGCRPSDSAARCVRADLPPPVPNSNWRGDPLIVTGTVKRPFGRTFKSSDITCFNGLQSSAHTGREIKVGAIAAPIKTRTIQAFADVMKPSTLRDEGPTIESELFYKSLLLCWG